LCCNPLHLEEVSSRTNILRGEAPAAKNARKLLCDRGHPLDREGAYWYKNRNGQRVRVCKICQAKRAHAWYERRGRKLYQQSYQPHPKIPPTHCPKGHPYNKKNTYWHARGNGRQRVCLICKNENYRAWWRRHGRDWQRRRRAAKAGR
jgi:hypothetical protein